MPVFFWLREIAEMLMFITLLPLSWAWKPPIAKQVSGQALVLIPGFLGRGLELMPLRKVLEKQGFVVHIVPLGFQAGAIAAKGQKLADYLETHDLKNCYLLGYSLGGWVALALPERARWRVNTLITLGVAFRGTPMACLLGILQAARQLIPGSGFLKHQTQPWLGFANHINIYAQIDEITASQATSELAQVRQMMLPIQGHFNLVKHPLAQQVLLQTIIKHCSDNKPAID
jgi:pimeloyl-ACP methyl ester carboxylesterase